MDRNDRLTNHSLYDTSQCTYTIFTEKNKYKLLHIKRQK